LIPLVGEHERDGWETTLTHLREMLEGLSALGSTPTPNKDTIPALARAMWKARGCPEVLPKTIGFWQNEH